MRKLFVLAALAAICGMAFAATSPQENKTLIPPTKIPGDVFVGDYLRIGINDAGTIGVSNPVGGAGDPGVGLQWAGDTPWAYPTTESLAIYTWGEGFFLGYNEADPTTLLPTIPHRAQYISDYGWPLPAMSNLTVVPQAKKVVNFDPFYAAKEVALTTNDGLIRLTFLYTFYKDTPGFILKTSIKNQTNRVLRDVTYKRFIDFDVLANIYNDWASNEDSAIAWTLQPGYNAYVPPGMFGNPVRMSASAHDGFQQTPNQKFLMPLSATLVDLNAWDDMFAMVRSPLNVEASHITLPGEDCIVGLHYTIGVLAPNETREIFTVYSTNLPQHP